MRTKFQRDIYLFLSLYRFFAYGLAVVLIQVVPGPTAFEEQTYLLLITVGVYTLMKVMGPLRWWQRDPMTYVVLGGDLLVGLLAVLLTGGITSGFLFYSLLPVITAALLFEERLAWIAAGITSSALGVAHLVLSRWADSLAWIMDGNLLLWLIFYTGASFLFATSIYRTNLNISQHIQQQAIMEERSRMRREIHDGVAQALSYLSMKMESVGKLIANSQTERAIAGVEDVRKAIDDTYKTIRESLDQLSVEVGAVPLAILVKEYLRQFEERTGIHAYFDLPAPIPSLQPIAELQILRITQEALSNVRKHAQATEVRVSLASVPGGVEACIKDNGLGFDVASRFPGNGSGHHGLAIMRERADGLGGSLTITAAPGAGTEVRVFMPGGRGRGVLWNE